MTLKEYSVSEVSKALQNVVENNFASVRVRGEISGLKVAASGHVYLSLKDEKSVLNMICWRGVASKLKFKLEDGLEVIANGKITTYAGRSNYQIIASSVEPAGKGALWELFEKRKEMLRKEGLFATERKKAIPFLPSTIGVVTSPTGAVIRDILNRIGDRFPRNVLIYPALVQGNGAAEQIAEGIKFFNKLHDVNSGESPSPSQGEGRGEGSQYTPPDVIIVARGGGSLEDLWAFNEEIVVRAVANSRIPIISAVGHETDTMLIDYAADKRASTPTAAAEMAVPVRKDLLAHVADMENRMENRIFNTINRRKDYVEGLSRGLPKPANIIDTATIRLDDWADRLANTLPEFIAKKRQDLNFILSHLTPIAINRKIQNCENRVDNLSSLLKQLDYKNVLRRGFAILRDDKNTPITSAENVEAGQNISVELHDGEVKATVKPK